MTSVWKRLLTVSTVLCLLLTAVSMTAMAADTNSILPNSNDAVCADGSDIQEALNYTTIGDGPAVSEPEIAVDFAAGDLIQGDLYYEDFLGRDATVNELREALMNRKTEIFLYWRSDVELTETDIDALMVDALVPTGSIKAGNYLAMHVLDYYAEWQPAAVEYGSYYNILGIAVAYSTTAEEEQALTDRVIALRSEVLDGCVNDYQKIKSIYDYIMTNVSYDVDNIENLENFRQHTAYGALTDGKASAIGYGLLFYYMANTYDLDADLIVGTYDGTLFIWNAVKLYDQWYQLDLGMDALTQSNVCFLFGLEDMPEGYVLPDEYLTPEFQGEYPFAKTRFVPEQAASGKAGESITWSFDAATATLTFSGSGKMDDQKTEWNGAPWFSYIDGGAHVVIGEGITYIGASSFWNRNLLSLKLPESLEAIGSGAFSTTAGLKELTLPKKVKTIEQYAFYSSDLESIKLPEGLVSIGKLAFASCDGLTDIDLPDSLNTIGDNAFSDSGLTEIFIPRNVTSIGNGAFSASHEQPNHYDYDQYLVAVKKYEVHPENTVYSAKDGLLMSKDGTKLLAVPNDRKGTFTVPAGVTEIGNGAFQYCEQLQEIVVPEGVTKIGEKAFLWNRNLSYVVIPDSVTEIGGYAFEFCKSLLSVKLPEGLTEISEGMFKDSNLRTLQVPEGVTDIRKNAFQYSYLYSIALPKSLKTVEAGAFGDLWGKNWEKFTALFYTGTQAQWDAVSVGENNDALTEVNVNYEEYALCGSSWKYFINDGKLEITSQSTELYPWLAWREDIKSVYWNGSENVVEIGGGMFKNCSNLAEFKFRDDITYDGALGGISAEAFAGCSSLETFTVPGSVYNIYNNAFADCTSLKTLYLSRDVYGYGENAFAGCNALTDVYTEKTEEEWANNSEPGGGAKVDPFEKLPNVTMHFAEATVGGPLGDNLEWEYNKDTRTLTFSGEGPMVDYNWDRMPPWHEWLVKGVKTTVIIEEGVTSVGAYALYGGWTLDVHFASTVESIGRSAFNGSLMERLVLNEGLKTVGDQAFGGLFINSTYYDPVTNQYHRSLILPEGLEEIGEITFKGTPWTDIYIPASVKSIRAYAADCQLATIYYGGTEEQWKQVQVNYMNDDKLKNPDHFNASCPHLIVSLTGKAATCTETGLTDGEGCAVCGAVTKEQQVINKLSHSFADNTCTGCGMVIDPSKPMNGTIEGLSWAFDINNLKLTITGEGAIPDYANAADVPWSHWSGEIVTAELAAGITAMGDNAFGGFHKLAEVSYGGTLYSWQKLDIGTGNEALTNAKLNTTEAFTDVLTTDWFYGPVNWAVGANVTGGMGNGLFGPNNFCTRAQVVTFLYAAAGKPEVTATENPFEDVANDDWYAKPVLWAVENGITSGIDATHFGPDATCTRAQVVTFLYAAAGKPDVKAEGSEFADVADNDWFLKPVMWAKENGVTGGINATEFGPNQTCTRAQVVTFLNKVYNK